MKKKEFNRPYCSSNNWNHRIDISWGESWLALITFHYRPLPGWVWDLGLWQSKFSICCQTISTTLSTTNISRFCPAVLLLPFVTMLSQQPLPSSLRPRLECCILISQCSHDQASQLVHLVHTWNSRDKKSVSQQIWLNLFWIMQGTTKCKFRVLKLKLSRERNSNKYLSIYPWSTTLFQCSFSGSRNKKLAVQVNFRRNWLKFNWNSKAKTFFFSGPLLLDSSSTFSDEALEFMIRNKNT